ncbi:MAG: hypothetical protein H6708_16960 [Kofleriaceae bacterium]|nr:hypothetical protein [Kofleriaceae bacterium]
MRATLAQGQLRAAAAGDDAGAGYPLCVDRVGARAPGRAYFERADGDGLPEAWPARYWAARCDDALVDAVGRPMRVDAVLGDGGALQVTVHVRCRADEADCVADRALALDGVGVAYAIADVDHDGRAELITSAASAPGDPDAVTVHALPARGAKVGKALFTKRFTGGVGGVAAADVDGDGDVEVFAAVRLAGSQRVDLWLLD